MPPKTDGKAAKKAGKTQKNISKEDKKKEIKLFKSKAIFLYKRLKEIQVWMFVYGISSNAGSIVNNFLENIFESIADEASRLAYNKKCSTVTIREIRTAVYRLLPRELAKEAKKALEQFNNLK